MQNPFNRGMGYLPDIPNVKDKTPQSPDIAALLLKTKKGGARLVRGEGAGRIRGTGAAHAGAGAAAAPAPGLRPMVDLRTWCSPIEDQGALGSCTANAAAGLVEFFENHAFGKYIRASRLFIYKAERDLLGWTGDTGAFLRTAMESLVLFGAPPEQYWPYDISQFDVEPSAFCYAFGARYRSLLYYRLDQGTPTGDQVLQNVKTSIDSNLPCMFGFPVYDEYMHVGPDGHVAYPSASSTFYGGHANDAVGYDDNLMIGADKGALLVRNSWGTGWGQSGYGWLSYKYVTEGLANDFWTLVAEEWVDTGKF